MSINEFVWVSQKEEFIYFMMEFHRFVIYSFISLCKRICRLMLYGTDVFEQENQQNGCGLAKVEGDLQEMT